MTGAGKRIGCALMLLQSCTVTSSHTTEFAALVRELRNVRDWIQQGSDAARILDAVKAISRPMRGGTRRRGLR
jgi:hypothetical protein